MRRETSERTESESRGLLGRLRGRGRSADQKPGNDGERSRLERLRGRSEERTEDRSGDESPGWFGRARAKYGLGAVLVAVGVALFLFPEPITSTAGLVLIAVGALIWLVSWLG